MLSAYALGAVDFLAKPLRAEVLKAKVGVFVELYRSKEELRLRERRDFEQRLEAKEERYRALFESIDEGFCVVKLLRDRDGEVRDYPLRGGQRGLHDAHGPARPGRQHDARPAARLRRPAGSDIYDRVARTGEADALRAGRQVHEALVRRLRHRGWAAKAATWSRCCSPTSRSACSPNRTCGA